MKRIVVIGDTLLDREWTGEASRLCPDSAGPVVDLVDEAARPGGAGLTAAAAAAQRCDATLVTALGRDDAAVRALTELDRLDVDVAVIALRGPTPEKIRVRVDGATVTRVDRGCAPVAALGPWTPAAHRAVARGDVLLLADYGRGMVAAASRHQPADGGVPVVWDPHPSSTRPACAVSVATPNLAEARQFLGGRAGTPAELALALAKGWRCAVAVTMGRDGVELAMGDEVVHVPTLPVEGDACGAGDWFAAGLAGALAGGAELTDAVRAGCASARDWVAGPHRLGGRPGGTLVATSGCFDVLHVGHLELLRHARSLGDRLVVLINSDRSVARLKGPGRPVNHEHDRVALLEGLDAVDEVIVFDEPTPCAVLEQLRPDVFVKGDDYRGIDIPELATMAVWGGRVEFAPLVPGRSTSRVIELAGRIAG